MRLKAIADHNRVVRLEDWNGLDLTGGNDAQAILSDAISGSASRPTKLPAGTVLLNTPVVATDIFPLVIQGEGIDGINATTNGGCVSRLLAKTSYGATTALVKVTATSGITQNAKVGGKFSGFSAVFQDGTGGGGYGFHIQKGTLNTDFWGNLTWQDLAVFNANYGIFLDDSVGGGNGFGWVSLLNTRLQGCNWGLYSNNTVNDLYASGCKIRQNKQSAASSFINHTGGGVYIPYGYTLTFVGGTYEGNQVAFHIGLVSTGSGAAAPVVNNVLIQGIYTEGLYDCLASILGSNEVTIQNVHTNGDAAKKIYVQNVRGVRQRCNDRAYFVVAPNCRDLETDTPELTRFTSATTGTTTIDDKGFWIHSVPARMPMLRPPRSAHYTPTSLTVHANNTIAALATRGPDGALGKCLSVSANSTTNNFQVNWGPVGTLLGDFVVLSVRIRAPTPIVGTYTAFSFAVKEGINTGSLTTVYSSTVTNRQVLHDEWVTLQWVHKVVAADISGGVCNYYAAISIYPSAANESFDIAGVALTVTRTPAVDPMIGVISCEADGSEFQYYLHNGDGVFYGAAEPTGSLITWNDSEQVVFNNAIAAGNIGTACTTAGTGGGTAVFKAFGVIAA